MKNLLSGLAFLIMSAVIAPASANPLQFNFIGTVTATDGSLKGIDVGATFAGSFGYDTVVDEYVTPQAAYYSLGPTSWIMAEIQGHTVSASNLSASVDNNFGGNVEDVITLYGSYPIFIDGMSYSQGAFGFNLVSEPGNTGVLTSTALPTSYDVTAFDSNSGVLLRNGSSTGTLLQFSVNSITAVPEPDAYALIGMGLGLLGFMVKRKKSFV